MNNNRYIKIGAAINNIHENYRLALKVKITEDLYQNIEIARSVEDNLFPIMSLDLGGLWPARKAGVLKWY